MYPRSIFMSMFLGLFPVDRAELFQPNSWWVSRQNQKMDYWGGSLPGSRKCECGILGDCQEPNRWCNCDSTSYEGWLEDGGDISEKEYLPVKQLRFGDTGTPVDEKEGRYTLGPLICEGDGKFIRRSSLLMYGASEQSSFASELTFLDSSYFL